MIGNFINIVLPVAGLMGFSTSSFMHYAFDAVLFSVCLSGIKRTQVYLRQSLRSKIKNCVK
ncbi:hypothetical protein PTTG_25589 [Puccinia triticina 1-1 BBBD Race 1]|uniref:Uncharacterized protein n=1 Tax=Puccinia triticina (isolate 1-1 / race 1 (BBBD)) TaxID=630390 RepID=A0A180H198_PUCT1|nr:hypothetical protein PTTG_25589 [Puccinia triticina 1-1 BBBD Race 1]